MPFHHLHSDTGMNFQINRVLTYGEQAGRLEDIRAIADRIHNLESWHDEWLALTQTAEQEKRHLHAAYGYPWLNFS